jgi:CheY-like chemotaxis protein
LNEGFLFEIYLPRTNETVETTFSTRLRTETPRSKGERVLLVEDEASVRSITLAFLTHLGYRANAFASGDEVLRFLERESPDFSLLVTDVVMPGMNGIKLVEHVRKRQPSTRVLFTSGFAEPIVRQRRLLETGAAFINKPFSLDAFGHKLREVLDASPSSHMERLDASRNS